MVLPSPRVIEISFKWIHTRDRTGILFSGFFGTGPYRDSGFLIPDNPVPKIPVDENQIPNPVPVPTPISNTYCI